ncbi:hypothetical protein AOC05_02915 [Arthrobacter alpinus]|uniref:Uncharacterized protein n=1 Tax=Arthrobacter alpinus TaxID=656366 RepID=A0A0M5LX15_9MICC|nr:MULTISPECIES: hypothetical protein [Arthrobacter]ALE91537.1 hypothetical protein AOC05_02915 [Arthrobacter alpinus]
MTANITGATLSRHARLAVAVAAGTVAMGMILAAPAAADDDSGTLLELSRDGIHFTAGTVPDIFNNTSGYVPGESRVGTVWVRNASRDDGHFSLGVKNTSVVGSSTLPAYLHMQAATLNHRGATGVLPDSGSCKPVVDGWTLTGGETIRLDLGLSLDWEAPNSTRNQVSDFELIFVLQGLDGGRLVTPCSGALEVSPAAVSVGTVAITGGTAGGSQFTGAQAATAADAGEADISAGRDAEQLPLGQPDAKLPLDALLQSNVAANVRSAWPWLVLISAGAYMVISLRRRRRTR